MLGHLDSLTNIDVVKQSTRRVVALATRRDLKGHPAPRSRVLDMSPNARAILFIRREPD